MRKPAIIATVLVVFGLGIGAGFVLDSESSVPAPAAAEITVAPSEAPVILGAINLMKPDFDQTDSSKAEIQVHDQLTDASYSYWTTYPDGTERLNSYFKESGKTKAVEFAIYPAGVHMDASEYGVGTEDWAVRCEAAVSGSPVDAMAKLMTRVKIAASKLNLDPGCTYSVYEK